MKKIISVLMVLGFVWMVAVPSFAGQEQEKKFKSELDDIKDPKEARWILIGSYNTTALLTTGYADDLMEYLENLKLQEWFQEGLFTEKDLMQLGSDIEKAINYVWTTAKLLNLSGADKGIPTMVWQSGKENKLYQGTIEDVRQAEKHIFEAMQLINKMGKSFILELIEKDKEKEQKKEKQSKN